MRPLPTFLRLATAGAVLLAALPARADAGADLLVLLNAYRARPSSCHGRVPPAAPPLTMHPALSRIVLGPGTIPIAALDKAGYDAEQADTIQLAGVTDARVAFDSILSLHCSVLSSRAYSAAGVRQQGSEWTIVLARPYPDPAVLLPPWETTGQQILVATNAARARARDCGAQHFEPAPALTWNAELAQAALGHSRDMATLRYFSHQGKDGRDAGQRARDAGYVWRNVGENIAFGQLSADETVAGWLTSPGHCANIMSAVFTEMGAAYAVRIGRRPAAYWTQTLGRR